MFNSREPYNSVRDIIGYLQISPFKTENQILRDVFGYVRERYAFKSNLKYAKMLRRGLSKGIIKRTKVEGKPFKYIYYV